MAWFNGRKLTVPAVLALIAFLSYSSQYLFLSLEPQPLTASESIKFNVSVIVLLICYARAVLTDPGRIPVTESPVVEEGEKLSEGESRVLARQRWCRVCNQRKPPRSHHCRVCKRCIPKMDHHCPWTYNCVSYRTWPHFLRFVFYSVIAMSILEYHLWIRSAHLWSRRHIPMYDGPTAWHLAHLFILDIVNTITLLALAILLGKSIWSMLWNQTTIEEWELDRHETLLRRSRVRGGYLDGPDGIQVRIKRQEFPFDIGLWKNISQSMGTSTVFAWFWPFASTLPINEGLEFETNGFEDPSIGWPPPDPDRIPRKLKRYGVEVDEPEDDGTSTQPDLAAFKQRQAEDFQRREISASIRRRQPFKNRYDEAALAANDASTPKLYVEGDEEGEESWRDEDGQRLEDFGLDEEAEFYDEDEDVPLARLIQKKEIKHV